MTELDTIALADIRSRHPAAFHRSFWKRYSALIGIFACVLYTVYCWWFFSIGAVIGSANWNLAANYAADWVSYEIRPDIELKPGWLEITYSRFSPLGENPNPDWLVKTMGQVEKPAPADGASVQGGGGLQSSSGSFVAADKANVNESGTANSTQSSSGSFVAPESANVGTGGTANSVESSAGSFVAPESANVGASGQPPATTDEASPAVPAAPMQSEEVVKADVEIGGGWVLHVTPRQVIVDHGDESYVFNVDPGVAVTPEAALEPWAEQRQDGSTVYLTMGWSGRAEIQDDAVIVWNRFLGWKNFVFDTTSDFWGMPASQVAALILWGDRIDPSMSNAALAFHDIWYNLDWQHGDVWVKLFQTIVMAFVGTVLASVVAFPLSFIAARNITSNGVLNQVTKRFFDFQRSVDMLIWALFFTRSFGPGPLAGIAAIFFTDTGTLGKLYSEALENVDDKQREGVKSVGAAPVLVQRFGVLPQVLPLFASQALYFWESNTRSATIIGAVGAGGIGLKLWEAMRTNQNWGNVAYMVLLILIVVFVFDMISSKLRGALIGKGRHT